MCADRNENILIQLKNVSVEYTTADTSVCAVSDVSLSIPEGEFVTIIGPSGCGKTSLLNVVANIIKPSSGQVEINGRSGGNDVQGPEGVGFVFQDYALLPWRTVLRNVCLPLEILRIDKKIAKEKALQYIKLVGLMPFQDAYPRQLSGGMKQRVAIARALITESPILLMDEPFSALDEIARVQMQRELQRIWLEANRTVVFVTHNISEAVFLSDRIVILTPRPGQIAAAIEINLPRPRSLETISSKEFFDIGSAVRSYLFRAE